MSATNAACWFYYPDAAAAASALFLAEDVIHTHKINSGVLAGGIIRQQMSKQEANSGSSWTSLMRPLLASAWMEECVRLDWGSEKLSQVPQPFPNWPLGWRHHTATSIPAVLHAFLVCVRVCVCVWTMATLPFWPNRQGASAIVARLGLLFKLSGISNCEALCGELPLLTSHSATLPSWLL